MSNSFPANAQVVIIGGGIMGCSVAYHLTKLGWKDVVLLERKSLTCGTTWHAAGLVAQLRATHNMTLLAKYTAELYRGLEEETGQATGFRQAGSLTVASTAERFEELKRSASMGRCFDVDVNVLTPEEAKKMWPLVNIEDIVGAIHIPKDGMCNPIDTTTAPAKGAKMGGASIFEDFSFDTLPEDWDHFEPVMEKAIHRLPALAEAGIQLFFCGPESFTPDDRYLLGEAPELKNFFVAAGFNSVGIQSGGGVGKVLASWIVDGAPPRRWICEMWIYGAWHRFRATAGTCTTGSSRPTI